MRGIRWQSGSGRLAGRAVTVQEEVAALSQHPVSAFEVGRMLHAAHAGEVLETVGLGVAERRRLKPVRPRASGTGHRHVEASRLKSEA